MAKMVREDNREHLVFLVTLAAKDLTVHPARRETWVHLAPRDSRDPKVRVIMQ